MSPAPSTGCTLKKTEETVLIHGTDAVLASGVSGSMKEPLSAISDLETYERERGGAKGSGSIP